MHCGQGAPSPSRHPACAVRTARPMGDRLDSPVVLECRESGWKTAPVTWLSPRPTPTNIIIIMLCHDQGRLYFLSLHPCRSPLCSVACLPEFLTRQPTPRDIALLLFHYMSGQRPHYSALSGLAPSALGLPPTTPTGPIPSRPCEYMYMLDYAESRLGPSSCNFPV
jgi:hypothetical protein